MNGIASKLGIATASLEDILDGKAPNDVASRLSTSTAVLQEFIDGKVNPSLSWKLGGPPEDLQRLRDRLGKDGAVGIVIGYLAASGK